MTFLWREAERRVVRAGRVLVFSGLVTWTEGGAGGGAGEVILRAWRTRSSLAALVRSTRAVLTER